MLLYFPKLLLETYLQVQFHIDLTVFASIQDAIVVTVAAVVEFIDYEYAFIHIKLLILVNKTKKSGFYCALDAIYFSFYRLNDNETNRRNSNESNHEAVQ